MDAIDQAPFNFSPTVGLVVAVMVGFLVFAVALDLTWDQFYRVLRRPRAPLIGLAAQFLVLPGVAFAVAVTTVDTPSIALGLLLVTCCPAGALSNLPRLPSFARMHRARAEPRYGRGTHVRVMHGRRARSRRACRASLQPR